jgi:hypothetical protein
MMGRWKKDGNHSPHKNKLVQDPDGNEENRYPVPNSSKIRLDYPKKPNEAHKNTLKEETLQEITENFMEMLLDQVNQKVQEALKKFWDNKNKEYEKTQKQISELTGVLNKYQSEAENIINREINELRGKLTILKRKWPMIWQTSKKEWKKYTP